MSLVEVFAAAFLAWSGGVVMVMLALALQRRDGLRAGLWGAAAVILAAAVLYLILGGSL